MTTPPPWSRSIAAVLVLALAWLVTHRYAPPDPAGPGAPADRFSAARALAALRTVLGDQKPHPVGSQANMRVRARIIAELARLGYTPRVETGSACNRWGDCAEVRNVVARLDGTSGGPAVLLACHYDSVAAGPGAADDGSGVAAMLEIARILRRHPPRRPVVFLFDDGEEAGLLGARAFVERDPAAQDVREVVNLEARGTSGPSMMFETSDGNFPLARRLARALDRPVTSSAYYEVYSRMPNDTDLTVFRKAGLVGVNFAFVGGAQRYHTAQDTIENLDRGSLQHHGDNALALVRELADGAPTERGGDAVFFDLLAALLITWPVGWSWAFVIAAALGLATWMVRAGRQDATAALEIAWGAVPCLAAPTLAVAFGVGVGAALQSGSTADEPWVDAPLPALGACWSAGLFASALAAGGVASRVSAPRLWCATWLVWTVLALGAVVAAPAASFLFAVPALVAGVCAAAATFARLPELDVAMFVGPPIAAAVVWLPHIHLLYDAIGLILPIAHVAAVTIASLAFVPLAATRRNPWRWLPSVVTGAAACTSLTVALVG